jgi:hypothetical protein
MKSLLTKYYTFCPTANKVLNLRLPYISFDHIAIRAMNKNYYDSNEFIEKFEIKNYKKMPDSYKFPKYDVEATWYKIDKVDKLDKEYENSEKNLFKIPRIFTSWYSNTSNVFSPEIQNKNLTYNEYLDIHDKNQYVAWTLLFKQDINHIAIEVEDIEYVTESLMRNKYKFNKEGGIYKISNDKNLIQTSIMADTIEYQFKNKKEKIPYAFVEFVQRKNNRDGFETESANKIFSSTNKITK